MGEKFELVVPNVIRAEANVFKTIPQIETTASLPAWTADHQGALFYATVGGAAVPYFADEAGFRPVLLDKNGQLTLNGQTLTIGAALNVQPNALTVGTHAIDLTGGFLKAPKTIVPFHRTSEPMSNLLWGTGVTIPVGSIIFDDGEDKFKYWTGASWQDMVPASNSNVRVGVDFLPRRSGVRFEAGSVSLGTLAGWWDVQAFAVASAYTATRSTSRFNYIVSLDLAGTVARDQADGLAPQAANESFALSNAAAGTVSNQNVNVNALLRSHLADQQSRPGAEVKINNGFLVVIATKAD